MTRRMTKTFYTNMLLITVTLLSLLLSGCQQKEKVPEGPRHMRIATIDENTYILEFIPFFSGQFPDWDITVLPMDELKLYEKKEPEAVQLIKEFLEREKPDLFIMNSALYEILADKGIFRDLGEWVSRDDDVDLDSFVPGVIDILKDNEEGKLFGLSPGFHTSVFYYNKTMFRSYGVEEPHDRMTWSELLNLSNRFTQDRGLEKGSYGFYEAWTKTPFDLVQLIAGTEGMNYADMRTAKITLQSDEWRKIWDLVANSYRQGSVGTMDRKLKEIDGVTYVTEGDQQALDLFYQGKTAMTIGQNDLLQKLKGKPPSFEWGVYSGPVSTRDPERVSLFDVSLVLTIPTVSAQPDAAWEAIRYMHSDKMGKIYASVDKSLLGGLFSLKDFPMWKNDPNYEPFYNQRGWPNKNNFMSSIIPSEFFAPFTKLANEQMEATIAGKLTADQALVKIQAAGQALLDQLIAGN